MATATRSDDAYFLPISLGNHFYSNDVLEWIFAHIIGLRVPTLLVVCDELRRISYRARGLEEPLLTDKTTKENTEFGRRLVNCGIERRENISLAFESELISDTNALEFFAIRSNLEKRIGETPELSNYLDELTRSLIDSIYPNRRLHTRTVEEIQRHYLLRETALSIYVTEKLGYSTEVYKREDRGLIKELYTSFQHVVKSIVDKPNLDRRFESIEDRMSLARSVSG